MKSFKGSVSLLSIVVIGCTLLQTTIASPPLQLAPQVGFNDLRVDPITRSARLPRAVLPLNYKLEIRPILDSNDPNENFKAPGNVIIRVKCTQNTNAIEFHSSELTIHQNAVTVLSVSGSPVELPIDRHEINTTKETHTLHMVSTLVAEQEYDVHIPFVAEVAGNRLSGLYRSSYETSTGERRYLATTQFQKLGARKAFPCFDEPNIRSTFDVKIGRREVGWHSLFCTDTIKEPEPIEGLPGWVWDEYNTTLNMPTYILAIIVSDFTSETAPEGLYRLPVRTWGPPPMMAQEDSAKFSAEAAAKIINFFETYFDFPYEMTKMDSVAIPDFAAGAMENWGLNTYRINLMLFFKGESTQFEQWRQAAVISHELTHQWFGNLVTNDWWNDLWLNEGFARYMQFVGVNTTIPNLEAMNRVVVDTIQLAMEYDASAASVPVHSYEVEEVINLPSRIAYEKAGSLLRMMNAFLTEDTFIKGLRTYLKNNAYGNTVQDQLFAELQVAAVADNRLPDDITVKDIMDTWTLQTGFPIIKVIRGSPNLVYISQEKFLTPGNQNQNPNDVWYVPVTYATRSNPDFSWSNWTPRLWIDNNTLVTSISIPTNEWIFVNPDARSYYRVLYDTHFTGLIKEQLDLDHNVFSPSSRSQLLDDYFQAAYNGYVPIVTALDLTTYLDKEDRLVVWTTVTNCLRKISVILSDSPAYENFKSYVARKINGTLTVIGGNQIEGEPPIRSMLRTQLLDWACTVGHDICHETSTNLIQAWQNDPDVNPIAADIQPMIYCGAVAADSTVKDFLMGQHATNKSERQNTLMLNGLGCSSSAADLNSFLLLALDNTSSLYGVSLIQRVAANSVGRELAWAFLATHKTEIVNTHGYNAIGNVVSTLSQYYHSQSDVDNVETYISSNPDLPANVVSSLRSSVTAIRSNIVWMNTFYSNIATWLQNNSV